MLKGLIKSSTTPANYSVIATLPDDYKPSGRLLFGTSTAPNATGRIDIEPTAQGANVLFGIRSTASWLSLDTVHYIPAAGAVGTKVTPTLQNGFIPYGGVWEGPTYIQDPTTKRVTIQGLLNNGNRANGTVIFTLPAAMRPSLYLHLPSQSDGFHHLGVDTTNGLVAKGDGSLAYSINSSFLPSSVTGWTSLSLVSGWTYYGNGFATPEYVKTSDGLVQVKGLINSGSTTYGSVITTLPAGFRPKQRIISTVVNTGLYSRIDILPDGRILFMGSSNTWLALDNIVFPAEQ